MYTHIFIAILANCVFLVSAISPAHGPSLDVRGQSLNPQLVSLPLAPRDLPVGLVSKCSTQYYLPIP